MGYDGRRFAPAAVVASGRLVAVDAARWPFPLGWLYGNVLGNIIASALWALPTGWVIYRKLICNQPGCFRLHHIAVHGTTWHTCRRHATAAIHRALHDRHAARYPHAHQRAEEQRQGLPLGVAPVPPSTEAP